MKHDMFSKYARHFRTTLASFALFTLASLAQTANAQPANPVSVQTAEIEALLTAVHDVTSYNGTPARAIEHLATWYELWAPDATLSVNGGPAKVGRDAIIAFFAVNPLFNSDFVGLTPSFRTKISVHGDTAEVYLECIFLTPAMTVGPQRSLHGTVRKVEGKWLFWRMANDPAQPLFPSP